jgi:hypothetical protein
MRYEFYINDSWTVANTLVGVADGHLWVDAVRYGQANAPGMQIVDGKLYGRNYGHVFYALPFLWAFEGMARVVDPRVAVAAVWSLVVLALALRIGRYVDYERHAAVGGSVVALVAFGLNLSVATPLDATWFPLLALQTSTAVASAFVAVVLYRLVARIYSRRVGLVAGLGTVVATGFGFWAVIPKRHAVVTALLVATLYCLYRSREATARRRQRRFRMLAYVWVGLVTWVNALEGLVAFVTLLAVDLPTARSNDLRTLVAVAGAFALSLVPFFLTNYLVVGSPIEPPHLWPGYDGGPIGESAGGSAGTSGGSAAGGSGGAVGKLVLLTEFFTQGIRATVEQPIRLVGTFLRSGGIAQPFIDKGNADVELAMLETAPVLGVLAVLPVLAVSKLRAGIARPDRRDPLVAVDAFVALFAVLFTLVYISRLPLHAQTGVRYLLPLYALGLYVAVRIGVVRTALETRWRLFCWTAAGGVVVGGQLLFLALHLSGRTGGDLLQVHAWLGLALATLLAVWSVVSTTRRPSPRVGAVCLGLACAAGVTFVVTTHVGHFASVGDFALAVVRWVAFRTLAG